MHATHIHFIYCIQFIVNVFFYFYFFFYFYYYYYYYYLHSDALLHHIWKINQKKFPTFQDLTEQLQSTSREIRNKQVDTAHVLKFITWTLNINITVVKIIFRLPKNTGHQRFCLSYGFQNTFIKIIKTPNSFKPIHVITYKNKYYILNQLPTIFPLLLRNVNPQDQLTYKRIPVRADQILDIVQGRTDHLNFPFTINIYTAYSYTGKASNEIRTNMIGQLLAKKNTEEIFHVFLTPDIEQRNVIKINALENVKHSAKFDKHDLFTNTLITEGDKTVFKRSPKEVLLNQKNCICEHKETQDYSPLSRDRNLGIEQLL